MKLKDINIKIYFKTPNFIKPKTNSNYCAFRALEVWSFGEKFEFQNFKTIFTLMKNTLMLND